MRCWHANASGLRAKVEGQLARETLLQWVPVMQDCLSLLSLPLSLQAGRYASHKATLAIRLWTLLTVLCLHAATSVRRGTCSPCPLWPWRAPCPSFVRRCCGCLNIKLWTCPGISSRQTADLAVAAFGRDRGTDTQYRLCHERGPLRSP